MEAIEMQNYLKQLHAERSLAPTEELDFEIAVASHAYVLAAVTEIAMLRGQLYGRLEG